MIRTGEAGLPGFEPPQVRRVPFLQSRLRRQIESVVLAEPVENSLSGAEAVVCCKHYEFVGLGHEIERFRALACRLLIPHSSFESRWHQAFSASGRRASVRAGLPTKVHVQAARAQGPRMLTSPLNLGKEIGRG